MEISEMLVMRYDLEKELQEIISEKTAQFKELTGLSFEKITIEQTEVTAFGDVTDQFITTDVVCRIATN